MLTQALTVIFNAVQLNWMGFFISGATLMGILGLRMMYCKFVREYAKDCKNGGPGDREYEKMVNQFDDIALIALNCGAAISEPSSILSIIFGACFANQQGQDWATAWKESFYKYAGVNFFLVIIEKALEYMGRTDFSQNASGFDIFSAVTGGFFYLLSSVNIAMQAQETDNAFSTFIKRVYVGIASWIKYFYDVIANFVKKCITKVGEWFGAGAMAAVTGKEAVSDCVTAPEIDITAVRYNADVTRDFVAKWKEHSYTNVESNLWLRLEPGSASQFGNYAKHPQLDEIKSRWKNTASQCMVAVVNMKIECFCVPTDTIANRVQELLGVGTYLNNEFTVYHTIAQFKIAVKFSQAFSSERLIATLSIESSGMAVDVAIYGVARDSSTEFYFMLFGFNDAMTEKAFNVMSIFSNVFRTAKRSPQTTVPRLIQEELGLNSVLSLGVSGYVISGVVNWFSNVDEDILRKVAMMEVANDYHRPEIVSPDWWRYNFYEIVKYYYSGQELKSLDTLKTYYYSFERIPKDVEFSWLNCQNFCDDIQPEMKSAKKFDFKAELYYCAVDLGQGLDVVDVALQCIAYYGRIAVLLKTEKANLLSSIGLVCRCCVVVDYKNLMVGLSKCETHIHSKTSVTPQKEVPEPRGMQTLNEASQVVFLTAINKWIAEGNSGCSKLVPADTSFLTYFRHSFSNYGSKAMALVRKKAKEATYTECSSTVWDWFSVYWRSHNPPDEAPYLQRLVDNITREYLDATNSFESGSEDEQFEDACDDPFGQIEYVDASTSLQPFLLGFDIVNKGKAIDWHWHSNSAIKPPDPDACVELWDRLNRYGSKLKQAQWDEVSHLERVVLPKRFSENAGQHTIFASRAFSKMQQLYEADPGFWQDVTFMVDLACGYGGFEQCLGNIFYDQQKYIFTSSWNIEKHRIPDFGKMQVEGSHVKIINGFDSSLNDRGNIKKATARERYKRQIKAISPEGADMFIFDIGEFKSTSNKQLNYWMSQYQNDKCLIDAIVDCLTALKPGGKLLMKFTGYFRGGSSVLYRVLKHFKRFKAHKVGTQGHFSTEFYIYASGYSPIPVNNLSRVENFYSWIGHSIYNSLQRAQIILNRPKDFKTIVRSDWILPRNSQVQYSTIPSEGKPPGIAIKVDGKYWKVDEKVEPDWERRFIKFIMYVNKVKKIKFLRIVRKKAKNLCMMGHFKIKEKMRNALKMTANGLISDFDFHVFGIDNYTSTYGHTQSTSEYKEKSFEKRLDVDPGQLSPLALKELIDIMPLMLTQYGKSLIGKLKMLTAEEVLPLINNQGATAIISDTQNLGDFIAKYPNWYQICQEHCIIPWSQGKPTHSFVNIMWKNEPKSIKINKGGKLDVPNRIPKEELLEAHYLPHRYIQYFDEITRLSHYILLGDLIRASNKQKLYKGTINGTPPYIQGNVLKAVWDLHLPDLKRVISRGWNEHVDVFVDQTDKYDYTQHGDPAAVILDFSGWDGTVTAAERVLECKFVKQFYSSDLHKTIDFCFRDMNFAICLDHDGEVWLRAGQRGSGEIMTSFGNTLLVASNIARAICKILNKPPEWVLETITTIMYKVSGKPKVLEVTRIPQFSDGDDTNIITSKPYAIALQEHLSEVVGEANKLLRSGTDAGSKLVTDFREIEFCSHVYQPVVFGDGAMDAAVNDEKLEELARIGKFKLKYMPCKPLPDILSRLRLTLKGVTSVWKDDEGVPAGCVDITRSKIMSYLILYPHIRLVRYSCLTLLAKVKDGPATMNKFVKRYDLDLTVKEKSMVQEAIKSCLGYKLDQIGYRQYSQDVVGMRQLSQNAMLANYTRPKTIAGFINRMVMWLEKQGILDQSPLTYDPKFLAKFARASQDKAIVVDRDAMLSSDYVHSHKCKKCKNVYIHQHRYTNIIHRQYSFQCPWEHCEWYYMKGNDYHKINPSCSSKVIGVD
uniref:Polyprotein n=1 Tax=Orthopteran flavi-related virus TaxID=2822566 RepID=A0A8A6RGZ5_9FLAV|nr:polyprotein [Orthopteran flavi-related virus]